LIGRNTPSNQNRSCRKNPSNKKWCCFDQAIGLVSGKPSHLVKFLKFQCLNCQRDWWSGFSKDEGNFICFSTKNRRSPSSWWESLKIWQRPWLASGARPSLKQSICNLTLLKSHIVSSSTRKSRGKVRCSGSYCPSTPPSGICLGARGKLEFVGLTN
jgi:hypothetical protein